LFGLPSAWILWSRWLASSIPKRGSFKANSAAKRRNCATRTMSISAFASAKPSGSRWDSRHAFSLWMNPVP
jgi:hypothetical protein